MSKKCYFYLWFWPSLKSRRKEIIRSEEFFSHIRRWIKGTMQFPWMFLWKTSSPEMIPLPINKKYTFQPIKTTEILKFYLIVPWLSTHLLLLALPWWFIKQNNKKKGEGGGELLLRSAQAKVFHGQAAKLNSLDFCTYSGEILSLLRKGWALRNGFSRLCLLIWCWGLAAPP